MTRATDRAQPPLAVAGGPSGGDGVQEGGCGDGSTPRSASCPVFTVFTPTHNRATTLPGVYESLCRQTFTSFEWLVVDDASTDCTADLVRAWQEEGRLEIRYVWQPHGHKKTAFNRGVRLARGELFLPLDSDDACVPEALEVLRGHWLAIPDEQRPGFSAVTALCRDERGCLVGDRFPTDVLDSDPLEVRYVHRIQGEQWGFQRTDVLREYPFPEHVPGHVPEGVVWAPIGLRYKTRFVNDVLRIYRPPSADADEQVSRSLDFKAMAPGHLEWMLSILSAELPYFRRMPSRFLWAAACLTRFVLHDRPGGAGVFRRVPRGLARVLAALMAPAGAALYCRDRLVMLKKRWLG